MGKDAPLPLFSFHFVQPSCSPFIFVVANLVKPSLGAGNSRFVPALLPVQPFPLPVPLAGMHQASTRWPPMAANTRVCPCAFLPQAGGQPGRRARLRRRRPQPVHGADHLDPRHPGWLLADRDRRVRCCFLQLPLASLRSAATRGTFLPSPVASKISAFGRFGALGSHLRSAYVQPEKTSL